MKCFHHNDVDGRSAAGVVAHFTGNYNPADYFEVNYDNGFPVNKVAPYEKVYIVDLSFTESTINYLYELLEKECEVVHIDHHASTLDLYKKEEHQALNELEGLRSNEASGVALTWMYFTGVDKLIDCPTFVRYISDFDCWVWKYEKTLAFSYGIPIYNQHPVGKLWRELINEINSPTYEKLAEVIYRGQFVAMYVGRKNREDAKEMAYVADIEGHKCVVINKNDNSLCFGPLVNDYEMQMSWWTDGEKYHYSIYSTPQSTINCQEIAEKYGGGGHVHAAGFTLDDMPFKKVEDAFTESLRV